MPRKILIPVFAMPRTLPLVVSTSKKSGPLNRAVGACASAMRRPLAPAATNPASPLLITLRREGPPVRCFALMFVAFRDDDVGATLPLENAAVNSQNLAREGTALQRRRSAFRA